MIKSIINFETDMIKIITEDYKTNHIQLLDDSSSAPLLEIKDNSFWVRGVRVPIDEKEAGEVYRAFHQWLTWAWLNHDDNR